MKRLLFAALGLIAVLSSFAHAQISSSDFTIKLGDFEARGQITYPSAGVAPFPTVLLIHGSTPMDMNATITDAGAIKSQIFAQLSEKLSSSGFAVVRYNKRFVSGPGLVDSQRFYRLKLQDFRDDAKTVLEYAKTQGVVDVKRLFVYGWSEGSAIAADLALSDSSLRGLIVQGPVAYSFAQSFQQQFPRVGLPYLTRFADSGGQLDLKSVQAALSGDGGLLARSFALYLLDPTSTTPRLNPYMDLNKDGLVNLKLEATPAMAYYFQDDPQFLGGYASTLALPGLIALAPMLKTPMLISQGEADANTSLEGARALEAALSNHPDHTLKVYAGLGHSLGAAKNVTDDDFRPMSAQPLEDLSAWLKTRSK